MADLTTLQKQRSAAKASVTRIKNMLSDSMSIAELECRLGLIEAYFKQLLTIQTDIELKNDKDTCRPEIEELCIVTKSKVIELLGDNYKRSHHDTTIAFPVSSVSKLPHLHLPKFDGKYSQYRNFISSFKQLVDSDGALSPIEKFNHLLHCLSDQALDTIKGFQVTAENYAKALKRLDERYDNTTLIFLEHIAHLYELPTIEKPSAVQLRSLVDSASAIFSSLKSLGNETDICNAMIIHLVAQKLDSESRLKWKEALDFSSLPKWEVFSKRLERRCQFLESTEPSTSQSDSAQSKNKRKPNENNRTSLHAHQRSCAHCKCKEHWISGCVKFKAMEVTNRFDIVKKLGLCLNCLSDGHGVARCTSKYKCKICKKLHHTLLHRPTTTDASTTESAGSTATASVNVHMEKSLDTVILATAIVLIRDSMGDYQFGRALLDSCSQVNLVTERFANILNLPKAKTSVNILGVGGLSSKIKYKLQTTIHSRYNEFEIDTTLLVANRLSGYQPESDLDISTWKFPAHIELADEYFHQSQPIDLLIGADSFFDILCNGQIKLAPNLPTLQETTFGWVVTGRYKSMSQARAPKCCLSTLEDENLNQQLEYLWALEDVKSVCKKWTIEEQACEASFIATTQIQSDGRLMVKLPFKEDPSAIGSSHSLALKRFNALERRLTHDSTVKAQYVQFMKEYEHLGHMSLANDIDLKQPHYFIPHHCVLKPNSTSTKLRVVFDASAKSSQKSLNEILLVGPTIQPELYMQILRFRLYKYALTGDIVKMYRMVLVHPSHRQFQLILWRENENQRIQTYKLNTVTYGMSASPFLAVRSLQFLADKWEDSFKVGSNILRQHFYVDDMLTGSNDIDELEIIKNETVQLLQKGGFKLAKIQSNHPHFRDKSLEPISMNIDEPLVTNALGISWDPQQDHYLFSFQPKKQYTTYTKRSILSLSSSIFDPMGLLAPLIIKPRVLLQNLWIMKIDWDTEVPQPNKDEFKNFINDLENLHIVKIPRYVLKAPFISLQLHGFSDASIRAYGCCVYVRVCDNNGNIFVHLFTAKCRVAPVKKRTLPELELCGAHLLSRLYKKIAPLFADLKPDIFLWTDATVVLRWIQLHSSTLTTFVGNRISEMQDSTTNCTWRHVPTTSNPADLITRGTSLTELVDSIWFTGPAFLHQNPEKWPRTSLTEVNTEEADYAIKKATFTCAVESNAILDLVKITSSYTRLLRIVSWLFRFTRLAKRSATNKNQSLTPDELQHSLYCIVWNIQRHYFAYESDCIRKNIDLKNSSKSLGLFMEEVGSFPLLRVGGRLRNADIPRNRKHPFLLPNKGNFSSILVRHLHETNYHAGPKALIAFIRQTFWIVNARAIARKVVRSCVRCIRFRPLLLKQIIGDLPAERINSTTRPFLRCGVDFCGPINTYLKIRGKRPYKCYIAVFVCFSSKAVHLEAVSDLSADAFIAALKRLVGRRGLPSDIFCDNATNFAGADSKLEQLKNAFLSKPYQDNIHNYCSTNFISFHFIPPRAPHFGGIWEAAVKIAKGHLYRTLAGAKLTYEELTTALVEIEGVMNSRPISPQSSDPNDFEALTPGHLLIGGPLNSIPQRFIDCAEISYLERWQRIAAVKQKFWQRWSIEYIDEMIQRTKWTNSTANLEPGTLVLIQEENMAPQQWLTGRVTNVIPGKDGKIRVADVKTSKGIYRRPIHKLALLLKP